MSKVPDENDRARGIGPPLPKHPGDDTVPMPDPDAEAAAKAKADAEAKLEADRAARLAALEAQRVGSFMDAALTRMERRKDALERPIPLPWPSMAGPLGGGLWSGMYVLVGNTGSGKSQLALQMAVEAARSGTPVLYIGLELGTLDLTARLIGLLTPIPWSYLYLGTSVQLPTLRTKYAAELEELRRLPFHLEIGGPYGWSYDMLEPRVRAMRELYPELDGPGSRPILVVLDFLQLVSSPLGEREELRERIGRAAYTGRAVARDYDAAVVLVSSTSREHYAKLDASIPGDKGKPVEEPPLPALVGLGKDSGEVEYAADAVLAMRRLAWAGSTPPPDGSTVKVAVAKGRAVTPTWVELRFNGTRFSDPGAAPTGRVNL